MNTERLLTRWARAAAFFAIAALAACGGSDGGVNAPPASAIIDAAGGTLAGPAGAQIVVPAGALAQPTSITIAQDGAGAPALPPGSTALGAMFALTPHGTAFAAPATLSVPFDPSLAPAGNTPTMLKTNATQNGWVVVGGATVAGSTMQAQISSFSWVIIVVPPVLPTIAVQPADQSVIAPNAATFSVGATGPTLSGLLTFQWQRNGVVIAGANGASYSTGPTSVVGDDGAVYSVGVSNLAGTVQSSNALLTVTAAIVAPAITQQPADASVAVGTSASFTVVASGSSPAYQWQRSTDGGATFTDIPGANAGGFTLPNAQLPDSSSQFRVHVSNAAGMVDSRAATLTVSAAPPAVTATRLAAGDDYSLAVDAAGTPYSWGSDGAAQLGNGSASNSNLLTPTPLGTLSGVRSVSAGNGHGVAVLANGTAWIWGYRGYVDCGFGLTYETPVQIAGAANIVAASAGESHTLLLRSDGVVLSIGCNDQLELGRPNPVPPMSPAAAVAGLPVIVAVAAGNGYSLAVDVNGFVWAWGAAGVRGDGFDETGPPRATPAQLINLNRVVAIAAGSHHALALRDNGLVAAWGANDNGELGTGDNLEHRIVFGSLLTSGFTAIAAGRGTSYAVRADGVLLSWGSNNYGASGLGPAAPFSSSTPQPVPGLGKVVAVAAGTSILHALALRADGSIWGWGGNNAGQVGDGTTIRRLVPVPLAGLNLN